MPTVCNFDPFFIACVYVTLLLFLHSFLQFCVDVVSVANAFLFSFLFCFLIILTSREIPLKVKRCKMLIEGAADLSDRKVFCRFLPVPTFV